MQYMSFIYVVSRGAISDTLILYAQCCAVVQQSYFTGWPKKLAQLFCML